MSFPMTLITPFQTLLDQTDPIPYSQWNRDKWTSAIARFSISMNRRSYKNQLSYEMV